MAEKVKVATHAPGPMSAMAIYHQLDEATGYQLTPKV